MKKKIIPLVLCAAILPLLTISCSEDDTDPVIVNEDMCLPDALQDGLIAAYSFGNGSLNDLVGSADLTASNAQTTSDRDGNSNCAYLFQGAMDSYLTTQDMQFLNGLQEMTVSLWYLRQLQEQDYELLIGRGEQPLHCPDTYGEWSVGLYDGDKAVFGHGNSVWEQVNPQGEPEWTFVTATVNKATNTLTIYINGVLEETATGLGDCGVNQQVVEDIGNLMVGLKFKGKIDDITIYNRVLTQAEITQLFQQDPCCE